MDRIQKALDNHKKKYNCAQAVACAYCELFGVDEKIVFKAAEGFGLGLGGGLCTCGALSGAVMLCGLKNSDGNTDAPATKAATYQLSRTLAGEFQSKIGSCVCREIKGADTGVVLRSCDGCIEDAARLVEKYLL